MSIPRELQVDALELKDELQAKLAEKLKGLSPEEEILKLRELVENGPFGELWKKLRSRAPAAREERPSATESV